jgi:ferrous-iron efflux pump FieF
MKQVPVDRARQRALWVQAAGWVSVSAALIILALKGVAWWQTSSASVLASLVDSAMDLASSALNLMALRYAVQPADDQHRYGHGKAEALAAFAQSVLLVLSATGILYYALHRLYRGESIEVDHSVSALALMGVVMMITLVLVLFQRWVVQRTGSPLVQADSMHYRSDFLINGSVIVAIGLAGRVGWIDAAAAVLIALYLYHAVFGIMRDAVNELLDRELPREVDEQLLAVMASHPNIIGAHNLRTRRVGGRYFVQVDLEFPAEMPLQEVHDTALLIRAEIRALYPDIDLQMHFDPADEPRHGWR